MASSGGFKPSPLPPIADTGMKGFLKWYQREQPEVFKAVAPQIAAKTPQVFSDYNQSQTQRIRQRAGVASLAARRRMRGIAGLGDDFTDLLDSSPDSNIVAGFESPSDDINSYMSSAPTIDVSDAANTTSGTPTTSTSLISSLIAGITGAYTTVTQANTAQAITNLQLQRAQAGLAPLNIGMNANGIPTITGVGLASSAGIILLIGGGLLLFMMMGRGKKAA